MYSRIKHQKTLQHLVLKFHVSFSSCSPVVLKACAGECPLSKDDAEVRVDFATVLASFFVFLKVSGYEGRRSSSVSGGCI